MVSGNLNNRQDINRTCGNIKENITISGKEARSTQTEATLTMV
jgi:hypothetical protein